MDIIVGAANIGSFLLQGVGMGHLIKKSTRHPDTITRLARKELSSALAILNQFREVINDDTIAPLVARYNVLHNELCAAENSVVVKDLVESMISFKSDQRQAKEKRNLCRRLHHDIKVASDNGIFADILKTKNLTPDGEPTPSMPHPVSVAGCSDPRSEDYRLSTSTFRYALHTTASFASVVSDPFNDSHEVPIML